VRFIPFLFQEEIDFFVVIAFVQTEPEGRHWV